MLSPRSRRLVLLPLLAAALPTTAGALAAAGDTSPPVLDRVSVTPKRMPVGGSVRIRHRLSEAATLTVRVQRIARDGRRIPLGSASAPAPAGSAETELSGTRLRPGRHRVVVTAADAAGNRSAKRVATLRVVR